MKDTHRLEVLRWGYAKELRTTQGAVRVLDFEKPLYVSGTWDTQVNSYPISQLVLRVTKRLTCVGGRLHSEIFLSAGEFRASLS